MSKRCGNCGRYPFCEKIVNISYCCEDWIELRGNCITCLGCNKLEDEEYKGKYHCKNWRN